MPEERRFVEITRANVGAYIDLKLKPGQENLVAPNAVSIAQAAYEPGTWLRGIEAGGKPVGLVSMIDLMDAAQEKLPDDPENAAYLWRLMIDGSAQGQGHGRAAIEAAFAEARRLGRTNLAVHAVEDPTSAAPLYAKMGFVATDRVDHGERLMIAPILQDPPVA